MDLFRVVDDREWSDIVSSGLLKLGDGLEYKQFWRSLKVATQYATEDLLRFYVAGWVVIQVTAPDDLQSDPDVSCHWSNDVSPMAEVVSVPEWRLADLQVIKTHSKPHGWP